MKRVLSNVVISSSTTTSSSSFAASSLSCSLSWSRLVRPTTRSILGKGFPGRNRTIGTATFRPQQPWVEKISARVFCPHEHDGKGGIPVTIFSCEDGSRDGEDETGQANDDDKDDDTDQKHSNDKDPVVVDPFLTATARQRLAKRTDWESVMVHPPQQQQHPTEEDGKNDRSKQQLSFHWSTGEEQGFSAHATMAGAIRVAQETEQVTPLSVLSTPPQQQLNENDQTSQQPQEQDELVITEEEDTDDNFNVSAVVHEDDIVTLHIQNATFFQRKIPMDEQPAVYRLLRTVCGLPTGDLARPNLSLQDQGAGGLPTMVHVSVALGNGGRGAQEEEDEEETALAIEEEGDGDPSGPLVITKTLVCLKDVPALLKTCQAPRYGNHGGEGVRFQRALRSLNSSGLLLYTTHPEQDGTWLCRHFALRPSCSGNSSSSTSPTVEDPASGLATSLLAAAIQLGRETEINLPFYRFQQGQVMGRTSWVMVEDIKLRHDLLAKEEKQGSDPLLQERQEAEEKERLARRQASNLPAATPKSEGYQDEWEEKDDELENDEEDSNKLMIKARIDFKIMGKIEIDETEQVELHDDGDDEDIDASSDDQAVHGR